MRTVLLPLVVVLLIAAVVLPALAQETADVSVGGGLVARLRDRGAFATVAERVANVDQKIVEVVSSKDTQHPQVTVKQKGNLWTVYAWDIAVMAVYPAEAKANQMTEKALAQLWARNLTQQLPKATPCSKLPPEQLGYGKKPATTVTTATKPGSGVAAKPGTAAPPAGAATKPAVTTPQPAITPPQPVTTTGPKPVTATTTPVKLVGGEAGATLLIVDAMRAAREMNAEDWAARKEGNAKELYTSLLYYLTGQGTPPKVAAPTTVKPVTATIKPATNVKPVTTTTKPATNVKPVTPTTKPATTTTKPATATTKPATATTATVTKPAADASTAKVPQKNRWRAKFAAAKPAYDKLVQSDPEAAKPINDMLAASRQAFAYGNFDEAEKQVDAALAALGVTYTE